MQHVVKVLYTHAQVIEAQWKVTGRNFKGKLFYIIHNRHTCFTYSVVVDVNHVCVGVYQSLSAFLGLMRLLYDQGEFKGT